MKERPILFSGEMVRAILDGRKTMTRRVIKPQPDNVTTGPTPMGANWMAWGMDGIVRDLWCPYGQPGDRLWVRETFATDIQGCPGEYGLSYRADHIDPRGDGPTRIKWTPGIHMFREYSRINLEITNVSVERLQDITEDDAIAEGVQYFIASGKMTRSEMSMRSAFAGLWDSINLKRGYGWDTNPWVWVIEFKRLP